MPAAYCRFSTKDYASDVYVYRDSHEGFITHVADTRIEGDVPKVRWDLAPEPSFYASVDAQAAFVDSARRVPITLPHAGASFVDGTAEAVVERLEALARLGYRVPESAFDMLRIQLESRAA